MKWETVDRFHELEVGKVYRVGWEMAARELSLNQVGKIADLLNNANHLVGKYHFTGVEYTPGSSSSGRKIPWRLVITFTKTGGGTPFFIVVGLIIAALLSIGLTLFGAGYFTEKMAESDLTPEERIDLEKAKGSGDNPFNSIVAILGLGIAAYALVRR